MLASSSGILVAMATEIERKFLVSSSSWRAQADAGIVYRQGYLTRVTGEHGTPCSVRVRVGNGRAFLNLKSATLGIRRSEYEYEIPLADANEILDNLTLSSVVEKTRYHVPVGSHVWEIDVFEGDNAGLIVAEIELDDENERFEKPDWLGDEVSDDPRYYNVCLADHPYKDWQA